MKRRCIFTSSLFRVTSDIRYNIPPSVRARRTHTTSAPSLGMRKNDACVHADVCAVYNRVMHAAFFHQPWLSRRSKCTRGRGKKGEGRGIHKMSVMHPSVYKMRYSRSCNAIHQTVYKSKLIKNFCVYDITCDITPRVSSVYYAGARN